MSNEKINATNQNRDSSSPSEVRQQHESGNPFADCAVIHSYTRKQALEDGFLVDLMQNEMEEVCKQHYKHPIACSLPVFEIMQKAVENPRYCNDYAGIAGRKSLYTFKLVCHPGDGGEPLMTIMLPEED